MPGGGTQPRIALVLGSGGIVGGAFHAGVLKALYDSWGIDARKVDLIVGTSAGSIIGALTAGGLHPNDLFRREIGKPLSPSGQRLLSKARALRGPKPNPKSVLGGPAAPEAFFSAAARLGRVSPGSLASVLLPRGNAPTSHVAGLVEGLLGKTWPRRPELRVATVELSTARRVIFGPDGRATPSEAVAASCAVPAVFEPVTIGDREYLDGGAHSADNVDVVGPEPFDLIIVSSPMSSRGPFQGSLPWSALRTATHWQTEWERRRLSGEAHVEIIRPTTKDLDAMGNNLLDPKRRPAVALQAHATGCAQFCSRANPLRPTDKM